jgi:two-component system NarL family sensor kinase
LSALRSPVLLFLATGLLALIAIVVGTDELSSNAAEHEAIVDARATSELLARSVVEPEMPRRLIDLDPAAIEEFDRRVSHRLWVTGVDRVKVWAADGTVLWSDQAELVGRTYDLGPAAREALDEGTTVADVTDLRRPENRYERGKGALEVYTRIESPEKEPLLFEVYYSAKTITYRQEDIVAGIRPVTLGALGLVVLVATGLLWALTRRLRRSAEERERLLRTAVEASDAERVRIARDLHDGVVQDLAGASFAVSALARSPEVPAHARSSLDGAGSSLRSGLRALRSLMVEIYPPDLDAAGLPAALDDLLAPAAAQGVTASARVADVDGASEHSVALVWRVAQEAVRNALRHSGARTLDVDVARDDGRLVLTVTDDGRGFDPWERRSAAKFGLRGMDSLIAEVGGRLDVRSAPGAGTTIRLEVDGER